MDLSLNITLNIFTIKTKGRIRQQLQEKGGNRDPANLLFSLLTTTEVICTQGIFSWYLWGSVFLSLPVKFLCSSWLAMNQTSRNFISIHYLSRKFYVYLYIPKISFVSCVHLKHWTQTSLQGFFKLLWWQQHCFHSKWIEMCGSTRSWRNITFECILFSFTRIRLCWKENWLYLTVIVGELFQLIHYFAAPTLCCRYKLLCMITPRSNLPNIQTV